MPITEVYDALADQYTVTMDKGEIEVIIGDEKTVIISEGLGGYALTLYKDNQIDAMATAQKFKILVEQLYWWSQE